MIDLESVDERLREWAYFFRDRRQLNHCRSIEHRFRPHSDDFAAEGWGDMESAPQVNPGRSYAVLRALQTHDAIGQLPLVNKWAITYGFCYPYLPKFVVLRAMKKFTGRRINWKAFTEALDVGRCRVHTTVFSGVFTNSFLTGNKNVA